MRKSKWLLSILFMVGAIGIVQVGAAQALSFNANTNVTINEDQIDSTVFAAGQTVDISSDVNGDIFCAGQTVNINGDVAGDIICAGQSVTINGDVGGDIRVAGQTVAVNGIVDGSLTAAGQTFTLSTDASIGRDASIGSAIANINGLIGRDLLTGGDTINVSGEIDRDIVAGVAALTFEETAVVRGDVDYTSDTDATVADGAQINGELVRTEPDYGGGQPSSGEVLGIGLGFFFYALVSLLAAALVLTLLAPNVLHKTTKQAVQRPWKVLLTGFLATVAAPVVIFLLMISFIGIPFALMILLAWMLLLSASGIFSGYYVGRLVWGTQTNPLLIMLAGGSLLIVLYFIPLIGFFALLAALWFGVGMVLLELFERTPKPVYDTSKLAKNS